MIVTSFLQRDDHVYSSAIVWDTKTLGPPARIFLTYTRVFLLNSVVTLCKRLSSIHKTMRCARLALTFRIDAIGGLDQEKI